MGHSGPPALTASILDAVYGDSNATTDSPGSAYGPTGYGSDGYGSDTPKYLGGDDESESAAAHDVPPLPFHKLAALQDTSDPEDDYDSEELFENDQPEDMIQQVHNGPPRFSDAVYEDTTGSDVETDMTDRDDSYSDPIPKDARLQSEIVRKIIFNEISTFDLFDMFDDNGDGLLNDDEILFLGYAVLAWGFQLRRVDLQLPPFGSEEAHGVIESILMKMKTREPTIFNSNNVIEKGQFHHFTGYVHMLFGRHYLTTPAREWGPEEVGRWLRLVGLSKYVRLFRAEGVTGIHLLDDIDHRLLEIDFDMPKFHAKKLLERIQDLRDTEESDESDDMRGRAQTTTTVTTTDEHEDDTGAYRTMESLGLASVGSPVPQLDSQSSYMLNNMSYSKSKGTLIIDSLTAASKATLNLSELSKYSTGNRRQDSVFNSLTFNQDDSDFPDDYQHQSQHSRGNVTHSTYGSMMSSEELQDGDEGSSVIADIVIIDNFVVESLGLKELWNNFANSNPERLEKVEVLDMLYSVLAWGYQKVERSLPKLQDAKPHVTSLMENIRQSKPDLFDELTIHYRDFYHFGNYLKEQYRLLKTNQEEDEPLNHWLSQVSDLMFTEQDRIDFGVFHSFLLKLNPDLSPDAAESLFKSISKSNGAFLTQESFHNWLQSGNPVQKQLLYKVLNPPAGHSVKPSIDNMTDTESLEYYGDEQRFRFDPLDSLQKKREHLEQVFKRYDPGSRGFLDLEGFKFAWKRLGFGGMFNDISDAFDAVDVNDKNEITLEQFQEKMLSPKMAKYYPQGYSPESRISALSPNNALPGLTESERHFSYADEEPEYPEPPYSAKKSKSQQSTPSLPKMDSNITVYENVRDKHEMFQITPKQHERTASIISWETNHDSPKSMVKPVPTILHDSVTYFRDFQSCVGIKQIFAMGDDNLNLMQVKLMLAQLRGVTKDEVNSKSQAVSLLKGKTLSELIQFLRTIDVREMQLLQGAKDRVQAKSKEKRWNAIILKGNVIGEGVERNGKEFEDRLTNVICNTFKQTLVKNTSWNEGGIEVSLIPGLSKKQLKQYNACLKQSNIEMRVKALQRKHHDVWNEGSELDVFDSYYQSWYAGTVIQCSATYGGSEKNDEKGNWLLVEWIDGEKEVWRETLARHGGHLRSRTIQTNVITESVEESNMSQSEPVSNVPSSLYRNNVNILELFQKGPPPKLESPLPQTKGEMENENDDIPTIPSRRIGDLPGPGKLNFEQTDALPFDSDVEVTTRYAWRAGDHILVYSFRHQSWLQGQIRIVFHDEEGEWLDCCYFDTVDACMRHKQIQRFDDQIQPMSSNIQTLPKVQNRSGRRLSTPNASQPFDIHFSTRVLYIDSIDKYLITSDFSKPVLTMIYDVFGKFGMKVLKSEVVQSNQVSPLHLKNNNYFKSLKVYLTEAVDSPRMELIWKELREVMSLFARKITSRVSDMMLSKAATNTCKNLVLRPENAEHYDRHRIQLFEMKVSRLFYKFDEDKDEMLKYDDLSLLSQQLDSHNFSVQEYISLCAKLDTHPNKGLSREQFQRMYKVGLRTLEKDYLASFGTYPNAPPPEKPSNNSIDYWSVLKSRVNLKAFFRGRNGRGEPIVTKADAIDILRRIRSTHFISSDDPAIKILANMTYNIMLKELSCTNSSIVALLEGKEPPSVHNQSPRALYISGLPNSFSANGQFFMNSSHPYPVYLSQSNPSISISYDQYQGQWIIENKKKNILLAYAKEKVSHPLEIAGLWRVLDSHTNTFVQSGLLQISFTPLTQKPVHQYPSRQAAVLRRGPAVRPPPPVRRNPPPPLGFPSTVVSQSSNPVHFSSTVVSGPQSGIQPPPPPAARKYDDPFNTSQLSDLKHQLHNQINNPPDSYSLHSSSHRHSLHSSKSFPSRTPNSRHPQYGSKLQHPHYTNYNNYSPYQVQKRNSAPSRKNYGGHRYPDHDNAIV